MIALVATSIMHFLIFDTFFCFLLFSARPPKIQKLAPSMEVKAGKAIRIVCRTSGKPKPLVTWLRDGLPVQKDKRTRIKPNE